MNSFQIKKLQKYVWKLFFLPSNNLWMRLSMLISPSAMFVAFDTWIQAYFTAAFIQHFTDQLSLDRTFSLSPRSCLPVFLSQFFPKILACTTKYLRPTSARLLQPNCLTSWTAAPLSLLSTTLSLAQCTSARLSAVYAESTAQIDVNLFHHSCIQFSWNIMSIVNVRWKGFHISGRALLGLSE